LDLPVSADDWNSKVNRGGRNDAVWQIRYGCAFDLLHHPRDIPVERSFNQEPSTVYGLPKMLKDGGLKPILLNKVDDLSDGDGGNRDLFTGQGGILEGCHGLPG
jgi:hypothetical protein